MNVPFIRHCRIAEILKLCILYILLVQLMILQNSSAEVDMQEPMENAPLSSKGNKSHSCTVIVSKVMMMMESLFWQPVLS